MTRLSNEGNPSYGHVDTCHDIGVAPHSNLTPWEVHGRPIVSVSIVFQWRGIKLRYSFVTDTLPNLMDEKRKGHETYHTSPSVIGFMTFSLFIHEVGESVSYKGIS